MMYFKYLFVFIVRIMTQIRILHKTNKTNKQINPPQKYYMVFDTIMTETSDKTGVQQTVTDIFHKECKTQKVSACFSHSLSW